MTISGRSSVMSRFRSIVLLAAMPASIAPPVTRADEGPTAVPAAHADGPPAPVAAIHAQETGRSPCAKAGAPAEVDAPEVAARPTTAEATPEPGTSVEPSPERRAVIERVAKSRQARAAGRAASWRWRRAAYAQQMIWLARQGSSGGATESSSSSPSSYSSLGCSSSGSSQDSTRQSCTPSYPIPVYTPSRPAPAPVQSGSLTSEILDAHRKMSQRQP